MHELTTELIFLKCIIRKHWVVDCIINVAIVTMCS